VLPGAIWTNHFWCGSHVCIKMDKILFSSLIFDHELQIQNIYKDLHESHRFSKKMKYF
jgi:hypothetical protein